MQHLEDVTPQQHRHLQIPNTTFDHLVAINALSVTVLAYYLRHTSSYNPTLTKLVKQAGAPGQQQFSRAYNDLISAGYLGRVEYTYERPAGDTRRSGLRASYTYVSRVPITAEQFAEIVHAYTPGRFVFTPIDTGQVDEHGQPVIERRRVKVLAAEVYGHDGPQRIDRDGLLTVHDNARGGRSRAARAAQARAAERAAVPEPENPSSGATRDNAASSQVAPETRKPDSGHSETNKNTKEEHQENTKGAGASLRSLPPTESSPPSNFRSDGSEVGAAAVGVADGEAGVSASPRARDAGGTQARTREAVNPTEDPTDAMTSEQARDAITSTLRRSAGPHSGPHLAADGPNPDPGTDDRRNGEIDDHGGAESRERRRA